MIFRLIIIYFIICSLKFYSVLTINIKLIQTEEKLLYSYLKTQSQFKSFYNKLVEWNDIENIKRIHGNITHDNIEAINFEHNVSIIKL